MIRQWNVKSDRHLLDICLHIVLLCCQSTALKTVWHVVWPVCVMLSVCRTTCLSGRSPGTHGALLDSCHFAAPLPLHLAQEHEQTRPDSCLWGNPGTKALFPGGSPTQEEAKDCGALNQEHNLRTAIIFTVRPHLHPQTWRLHRTVQELVIKTSSLTKCLWCLASFCFVIL